jgi:hypothetical protein
MCKPLTHHIHQSVLRINQLLILKSTFTKELIIPYIRFNLSQLCNQGFKVVYNVLRPLSRTSLLEQGDFVHKRTDLLLDIFLVIFKCYTMFSLTTILLLTMDSWTILMNGVSRLISSLMADSTYCTADI